MAEISNSTNYFDNNEIGINISVYHFAWIKNLSQLVESQITKGHERTLICDMCLCHFKMEHSFERHKQECVNPHGKNIYWEIYITEYSTFRYVQKSFKTRSTVLVQLDQQFWKKYRTFQKYSVESL